MEKQKPGVVLNHNELKKISGGRYANTAGANGCSAKCSGGCTATITSCDGTCSATDYDGAYCTHPNGTQTIVCCSN